MELSVFLFFTIFSATWAREGCVPGCECGRGEVKGMTQYRILSCEDFPSNSLPPGFTTLQSKKSPHNLTRDVLDPLMPAYITTLDLTQTEIEIIADETLLILPQLKILKLSYNRVKHLPTNVFKGCNQLQEIYLDNNGLTSLGENCFTKLPKLDTLFLQHNNLKTIPPLPPTINVLDISFNEILDIGQYSFEENIKYVDLCGNALTTVETSSFEATSIESLCIPGGLTVCEEGEASIRSLKNFTLVAQEPGTELDDEVKNLLVEMNELEELSIISFNIDSLDFLENKILRSLTLSHIVLTLHGGNDQPYLNSFYTQRHLQKLDLSYSSQLANIILKDPHVWLQFFKLSYLNLKNCSVHSLLKMQGHETNMYVDLSDNPLHCDCSLMEKIGNTILLDESSVPECDSPPMYKDQLLTNVHENICFDQDKSKSDLVKGGGNNDDGVKNANEEEDEEDEEEEEDNAMSKEGTHEIHPTEEFPDVPEEKNTTQEEENNGYGWVHTTEPNGGTQHPLVMLTTEEYYEHTDDKNKLVFTIIGIVIALTLVGSIIFSILFFYFRRTGHMGIDGGHAHYKPDASHSGTLGRGTKN